MDFQAKNVWSTPPQNESKFNQVETLVSASYWCPLLWPSINCANLLVFYFVAGICRVQKCASHLLSEGSKRKKYVDHINSNHIQESGKFCGVARLSTESRRDGPKVRVVFEISIFMQMGVTETAWIPGPGISVVI